MTTFQQLADRVAEHRRDAPGFGYIDLGFSNVSSTWQDLRIILQLASVGWIEFMEQKNVTIGDFNFHLKISSKYVLVFVNNFSPELFTLWGNEMKQFPKLENGIVIRNSITEAEVVQLFEIIPRMITLQIGLGLPVSKTLTKVIQCHAHHLRNIWIGGDHSFQRILRAASTTRVEILVTLASIKLFPRLGSIAIPLDLIRRLAEYM